MTTYTQHSLAVYHLARLLAGASDADLDAIRAAWPECPVNGKNTDSKAIRATLMDWMKSRPNLLKEVLATDIDNQPTVAPKPPASLDCPPLPGYAQLTPAQQSAAATAGRWLNDYVTFASQASPLTPTSFHLSAGIFAGALAIARRVHLNVGVRDNTIYPNLYILFVGHSTLPRKTTALRILRGLLREADMQHFLLADRQTPEALSLDLTTQIPRTFDGWTTEMQDRWLRERAIVSQRGWLLEEASHLLDSFSRDYSTGLLPLVLDLYDASDYGPTRNTISRGREGVTAPYICIFGATTYGALAGHVDNAVHWHNGLWARFALVGGNSTGKWEFWPRSLGYPAELIQRLRFIAYELLPMPEARVVSREMDEGDDESYTTRKVEVSPALVSSEATTTQSAWEQWERYSRATGYDMLLEEPGPVPPRFYASYGRLGTMLIKTAMILATFDADQLPVTVEARHVYRAQQIIEGWRANLHTLWSKLSEIDADNLAERIKAVLARSGQEWLSRRTLLRALGRKWSEIELTISDLEASGEIERQKRKGKRGPASEEYRLLLEA